MAWNRLLYWFVFSFVQSFQCIGQTSSYFFEFKDKKQDQRPTDFLSSKALQRREKQNIVFSFSDYPVDREYISNVLKNDNVKFKYSLKWLNGILVECDEPTALAISKLKCVANSKLVSTHNPTFNHSQGILQANKLASLDYGNALNQIQTIGVDKMHEAGITGKGVLIAVFDGGFSGVDNATSLKHLFDQNRIKYTFNIVENIPNVYRRHPHGTNALSCIAAYMPGSLIGTAHGADFALLISEDISSETRREEYNWMRAAEIADSIGADVISSSLGYYSFDDEAEDHTINELDGKTTVVSKAAQLASQKGILVVNSAGNNFNDKKWPYIVFPSDADSILSVGAVQDDGSKASFSAVGATFDGRIKPDVSALGVGVALNNSGNSITRGSGTSYSAPLIAGLAAGIWEFDPTLTNVELLNYIKQSSSLFCTPNNLIGYGVPNYLLAAQLIKEKSKIDCTTQLSIENVFYPNPISDFLVIQMNDPGISLEDKIVRLLDLSGKEVMVGQLSAFRFVNNRFDISNLKTGVYVLMIGTNSYKVVKL
jgi:serine protease AprX